MFTTVSERIVDALTQLVTVQDIEAYCTKAGWKDQGDYTYDDGTVRVWSIIQKAWGSTIRLDHTGQLQNPDYQPGKALLMLGHAENRDRLLVLIDMIGEDRILDVLTISGKVNINDD